jgi:hypothetical protein
MRIRNTEHTDRGMTLGELMIASSVLLVCLTSLAGLLGGSVTSSRLARIRDEAANLANEKIEVARSMPYDRVGLTYANGAVGDPAGDIHTPEQVGSFTVVSECTWVRTQVGRAAYKKLVVHVSWQQPMPGELDVTTMIYGKSGIVASGDLLVKLRYRETSAPVTNSTVSILASDNGSRAVLSDSAGEAFFGQAAVGTAVVGVTPPAGYIVDTSILSSTTIAKDALNTLTVYVQHPAQATIRVSDTAGARVAGASVSLRRVDGVTIAAVTTDANGDATFASLLYADYTATISKAGYPSATAPFTVGVGAPAPIVPVAVNPFVGTGIQARVHDVNGTAIPGATVTVSLAGNPTPLQTGVAGTNGDVAFTGLGVGTYEVSAAKDGYTAQTHTTYLHDGDHDTVVFNLVPAVYMGDMAITTLDKNGHARSIQVVVSGSGYYHNDLMSHDGYLLLADLPLGSYQVSCYSNPASIATVIINDESVHDVTIRQNK